MYPNDEGRQLAQEIIERTTKDLKRVRERMIAGEPIRLWYSNQPDEMCGLYWFMGQMDLWNLTGSSVSIIKLPEWEAEAGDIIHRRTSWGEVSPEHWHRYLSMAVSVSRTFIKSCADHWQQLQKENAPLRALVNGQLVSVPETLYDDFILREIQCESSEFYEARIIGRVMGNYQLGVCDSWIALRIEKMIEAGMLEIVSTLDSNMPSYHRTLKKGFSQIRY